MIYDYDNNIKVSVKADKQVTITMNDAIFTKIINTLYEGADFQNMKGHQATADDTRKLWRALNDKFDESEAKLNK